MFQYSLKTHISKLSIMIVANLGEKDINPESKYHSGSDIDAEVNIGSQTPVLAKSFNLLSACATGITTGNAWAVLGGGIVSSLAISPTSSSANIKRSRRCITEVPLVSFMNCEFSWSSRLDQFFDMR